MTEALWLRQRRALGATWEQFRDDASLSVIGAGLCQSMPRLVTMR